jgi:hypothetical protein
MNEWEEMGGSGAALQEREGAVRCGTGTDGVYGSTEWWWLREWEPEPNWQIGNVVLMLMFERVKLPSRDLAPVITATKKGRPRPNISSD